MITTNEAEPIRPDPNRDPVNPVNRKTPVEPVEADRFTEMMNKEDQATADAEGAGSDAEISPEELQRQIREGLFKAGFQKSMERAREMTKEMKQ